MESENITLGNKPAQEWTENREPWRTSGNIVMFNDSQGIGVCTESKYADQIVTSHNAALAAERMSTMKLHTQAVHQLATQEKEIQQLRSQLAAERGHYVRVVEEKAALVDALKDLFAMIDEGLLVRDISKDGQPDYTIRALKFTQRLAANYAALAAVIKGGK